MKELQEYVTTSTSLFEEACLTDRQVHYEICRLTEIVAPPYVAEGINADNYTSSGDYGKACLSRWLLLPVIEQAKWVAAVMACLGFYVDPESVPEADSGPAASSFQEDVLAEARIGLQRLYAVSRLFKARDQLLTDITALCGNQSWQPIR